MSRQEVYKEIEEAFGLVPTFFKQIPDSSLELEWQLFKRVQLEAGAVPQKYRELIGIAISAIMKCRYCVLFHTEAARLNGATQAEIEDAVHFAKSSAGWSTYLNGLQVDFDQFKEEMRQASEYIRSKNGIKLQVKCRDVGVDCDYVAHGRTEEVVQRCCKAWKICPQNGTDSSRGRGKSTFRDSLRGQGVGMTGSP